MAPGDPDARIFLEALHEPWRAEIADDPRLEEWLASSVRDARDAWPGAAPDAGFLRYLASKVPTLRMAAAYVTLRSREIFLMYACLHGDPRALAAFEKRYVPVVTRALERMKWEPLVIEETTSVLRERLFFPWAGARALALDYAGRGDLGRWLRSVAVRAAFKERDRELRHVDLSNDDMAAFTSFILQVTYPPNPIRALDDSLTPSQAAGAQFFVNAAPNGQELPVDRFHNCEGCHELDRNGNAGATAHPGFFGTDGRLSFENETQMFKVPHLRNAYQKVGMFESSLDEVHATGSLVPQLDPPLPAVRGFGFQHDGATGKLEDFFSAFVFVQTTVPVIFGGVPNIPPNPYGIPLFADPADPLNPTKGISLQGLQLRTALPDYVLAFDTNLFPVVGQEITLTPTSPSAVTARIALLEAQATAGHCDLVVHGTFLGADHGAPPSRAARGRPICRRCRRSPTRSSRPRPPPPAHRSPFWRSRRGRAGAWASTATATGAWTATRSCAAPIRPTPPVIRDG